MNCKLAFPPQELKASIGLPASKSISNRVLILQALSGEAAPVHNLSDSDDTKVLQQALHSGGPHFNIGAAGTAMRFLTAYLSRTPGEWTITGTERMKNRPIRLLADALNHLGAQVGYMEKEGFPPLQISGRRLQGGEAVLSGGVSSQYISALLMIAPRMEQGLVLHLEGEIVSVPYIRLTVELMKQYGVAANWQGQTLEVSPQTYSSKPFTVESDWSAASYWYSIAALSPNASVELRGLFKDSLQGDSAVARLYEQLGVETRFAEGGVHLRHTGKPCSRMDYNFVNEPDLAQTFVVGCCLQGIPFRFTGLQSLRIKETDRIAALQTELQKLGYLLHTSSSTLEWNGERCTPEPHPVIATYEDHRMAMAFAPAALVRAEGIEISHPEVVTKSYPRFWDDLTSAGFQLTMDN
ncbi:3-phosphoshikimate 1-carboxyvinyltransferase [Bacteroidia bacterium]|nr:3-phosphoshikimate 1-carboxyvinyltransferase [Bacteroidia bacterium]